VLQFEPNNLPTAVKAAADLIFAVYDYQNRGVISDEIKINLSEFCSLCFVCL
jgi:hypothetical protein